MHSRQSADWQVVLPDGADAARREDYTIARIAAARAVVRGELAHDNVVDMLVASAHELHRLLHTEDARMGAPLNVQVARVRGLRTQLNGALRAFELLGHSELRATTALRDALSDVREEERLLTFLAAEVEDISLPLPALRTFPRAAMVMATRPSRVAATTGAQDEAVMACWGDA